MMSFKIILHYLIAFLSKVIDVDSKSLLYASCILSTYPLALFYRKFLKISLLKHLFSIVIGIVFCYNLFSKTDVFHIIGISTFTLITTLYLPIKYNPHLIVFAVCMFQLSYLHISYMLNNWMVWTVDVTGVMMLLMIKLTSFSFDYIDGKRRIEELKNSDKDKKEYEQILKQKRELSYPGNLVEWFGYAFFFPSFLTGPTLSYSEYIHTVNNPIHPNNNNNVRETRKKAFTTSFYFLGLYIIGVKYFPLIFSDHLVDSPMYIVLGRRLLYAYVAIVLSRCKYYFGWIFSKSCSMAIGVSEESSTNVNIMDVEFGQNARQVLTNWNICTSKWLKKHIYSRMMSSGWSSTSSTLTTNFVSAFWHGFYPGYYFTFFTGGIITELGKQIRRKIRPYFKSISITDKEETVLGFIYDFICALNMMLIVTYAGIPFQLYGISEAINAWSHLYFIGHIMIAFGFIIVLIIPTKKQCKDKDESKEGESSKEESESSESSEEESESSKEESESSKEESESFKEEGESSKEESGEESGEDSSMQMLAKSLRQSNLDISILK
jgi:lysophospholipid acyltransferase